jgi:hypothetical protein
MVSRDMILSILRLSWHHQHAKEKSREKFAKRSHFETSLLRNDEGWRIAAQLSPEPLSGSLDAR